MKRPIALLLAASFALISSAGVPTAQAAIVPAATAQELLDAMTEPDAAPLARYLIVPGGNPNGVSDSAFNGFPTKGDRFAILTTGDATLADDADTSGSSGTNDGGSIVRGDTVYDATIIEVEVSSPPEGCTVSFDYRFLTEEHPEWVDLGYNDAFIVELERNSWSVSSGVISAPDAVVIESVDDSALTNPPASGTTYDGATAIQSVSIAIPAGERRLFFSIFDQGDGVLDTAAFLDNWMDDCRAPSYPPEETTVEREPNEDPRILRLPDGWDCRDASTNAPVAEGDSLSWYSPGVTCYPTDPDVMCRSVSVEGGSTSSFGEPLYATSTCGAAAQAPIYTGGTGVAAASGYSTSPWSCIIDGAYAARIEATYVVSCQVNVAPGPVPEQFVPIPGIPSTTTSSLQRD